MVPGKFRAIIIGGGPIGLAIANGLDRAGLDFVILERYPAIASDSGAGIMLWPHTDKTTTRLDGTPLRSSSIFKYLSDKFVPFGSISHFSFTKPQFSHGYPCMNFPRPALVQTLFDGLGAAKTKVRTGANIDNIEMTEKGVRVHLHDGGIEEGSIVIGADGVHSQTRAIMQKLAEQAGDDFAKDEDPIVSSYQIMYGRAKCLPNAEIGTFYETHGTYMSSQVSADKKRMHFGIYRKLPNPTTDLKKEYSEDEVAEFVEAFSDVMVMPRLSFAELYKNCEWTKLVNQPEGLVKRWHYGRIVLAGDSSTMMTAAAGMGVNNGIQSAVLLVNKLYELLSVNSEPDTQAFERVFEEYQNTRREQSQRICGLAARMIRTNTWDSYMLWFLGDVVFPWLFSDEKLIAKAGTDLLRGMYKFSFIEKDLQSGKIPWLES
ncbi:hypothetical protein ONZ43_g4842 [Nemania bipapillata]|uniref:Uncharacterized protein n=1 Tax=Nemania bipapillata TaxID=110536 RepID=A0ACC2IHS1_9PEZI|nr:hypothetical protein ONZ43_g4842 [Nemania bipapillata]